MGLTLNFYRKKHNWGTGVKKANRLDVIRWGLYGFLMLFTIASLVDFLVSPEGFPTVFMLPIGLFCMFSLIMVFAYSKKYNVSPIVMTVIPAMVAFFLTIAMVISKGLVDFEDKQIMLYTFLILVGSITMAIGLGLTRIFLHEGSWIVFVILPVSIYVSYIALMLLTSMALDITGWSLA